MDLPSSPCVRNCCLNEKDICLGCFRTLNEITGWSQSSSLDKQDIIANSVLRREQQMLIKKDINN